MHDREITRRRSLRASTLPRRGRHRHRRNLVLETPTLLSGRPTSRGCDRCSAGARAGRGRIRWAGSVPCWRRKCLRAIDDPQRLAHRRCRARDAFAGLAVPGQLPGQRFFRGLADPNLPSCAHRYGGAGGSLAALVRRAYGARAGGRGRRCRPGRFDGVARWVAVTAA